LDAFAKASNTSFQDKRYGFVAEASVRGRKLVLLKPSTYMNLSGKAVRYWMNELKIQPENLLVISDDLNIPFGTLRLRKNGSAGGHNGLTNITELIGTQEYARIRVGIGNDFGRGQQVGYVLGELSPEEKKEMEQISKRVIDGVKAWATIGPDRAMNTVNTKPKTIASEGETQAK
jgi:PTH1 family peptidyl-tRNA hydrolase